MLSGSTQLDLKKDVIVKAYKQYSCARHAYIGWLNAYFRTNSPSGILRTSHRTHGRISPSVRLPNQDYPPFWAASKVCEEGGCQGRRATFMVKNRIQRYEQQLDARYWGLLLFLLEVCYNVDVTVQGMSNCNVGSERQIQVGSKRNCQVRWISCRTLPCTNFLLETYSPTKKGCR